METIFYKKITVEAYSDATVHLCIGSDTEMEDFLRQYTIIKKPLALELYRSIIKDFELINKGEIYSGKAFIIWLNPKYTDYCTIVHACFIATRKLMRWVGTPLCKKTENDWAYMNAYILKRVNELFEEYKSQLTQ